MHFSGARMEFYQAPLGQPGNLIQLSGPNATRTKLGYDAFGNLTRVTLDNELEHTLAYNALGRLQSFTDTIGRTWELIYDTPGRLIEIRSPSSDFLKIEPEQEITEAEVPGFLANAPRTNRFEYSATHSNHIYYIRDGRGAQPFANYYDEFGRVERRTINRADVTFEYQPAEMAGASKRGAAVAALPTLTPLDPGNSIVWVTDRDGDVMAYELHGPNGGPGGVGAFGLRRKVQYTESGLGRAALRSDEPLYREQRWLHDCDCLSPVVVTQPFSNRDATSLQFDANGIPANWPRTILSYNAFRQVTTNLYTDGTNRIMTVSTYQANAFGQSGQYSRLISQTDPRAHSSDLLYAGLNFVHSYEYDLFGNRIRHTSPLVTRGVTVPQAISESWTYNQHGQVLSHADANTNVTLYAYHTGPIGGGSINTAGTFSGYLASITRGATGSRDPAANLTQRMLVNALGMVTEHIDPKGNTNNFVYNNAGELTLALEPSVTLRNSNVVRYMTTNIYDGAGNLVLSGRRNLDLHGNVLSNAWVDHIRSYDAVNNVLSERVEVDHNDANDLITRYAYTLEDQLAVIQKPEGNRLFHIYDERGLPLRTFYGIEPGVTITAGYPGLRTATSLGGTTFVGFTETDYDARGNATRSRDGRGNYTRGFFDFRNRQIAESDPNGNGWTQEYDVPPGC